MQLGEYLHGLRERKSFSLRDVARQAKLGPGHLSRIERGLDRPSDEKLQTLAKVLGEDPDVLFAIDGRVTERLRRIITRRPKVFATVLEELDKMPDDALLQVVRVVRDGEW